ncbi:unnamed protein product, partial [Prorocentrum cordatum]
VAKKRFASLAHEGRAPGGAGPANGGDAIGELSRLLKREEAPVVHVDVGQRLKEIKLDDPPPALWPRRVRGTRLLDRTRRLRGGVRSARVDALAGEVAKLKKKGVANPFVRADLRDWSPLDAPPAAGANALTWNEWHMAIDAYPARVRRSVLRNAAFRLPASYAIGAAVTGQLAYASAMAHKQICMRVAMTAHLGGRTAHLGMLYDESCRKDSAEKAAAGVPDFAVDVAARKVCRELLTVAEQAHDRAE